METCEINLDDKIEGYRCFVGNSKIVYLKATMATYLELGRRLHAIYGCSVICVLGFGSIENDKNIIDDFISRHHIADTELFYFSHAQGCSDGLELADCGVPFKKMVFTNMPLGEKLNEGLTQLKVMPNIKVLAIFTEKNRSFEGVTLLKDKDLQNVEILMSRDVYHSRKIVVDKFKELLQEK